MKYTTIALLALMGCSNPSLSYTNSPQTWQCGGTGDFCDNPRWLIRMEL